MFVNTPFALSSSLITPPFPLRLEYLSRSYHGTVLNLNRQTVLKMKFKLPLLVPRINIPRTLRTAGCRHLTPKHTCLFPYFRDCLRLPKQNMPDLSHRQLPVAAVIQCGKFPNLGISIVLYRSSGVLLYGNGGLQTVLQLSR